jgi:hypothetical protein
MNMGSFHTMPGPPISRLDRLLAALHGWVWRDAGRRARKLLRFAETEADGGRDLARAAEQTSDPTLRRLLLRHAQDELRHAELFASRGRVLLRAGGGGGRRPFEANWLAPGERGLDALRVDGARTGSLLAFLHLSEKAAAGRFALYHDLLGHDPGTQAIFADVLRDEEFHMTYTKKQLQRLVPARHGLALWRARGARLWRAYLRAAAALAGLLGGLVLTVQYFVLLPPFALLAKRAARREPAGWRARGQGAPSLRSQA